MNEIVAVVARVAWEKRAEENEAWLLPAGDMIVEALVEFSQEEAPKLEAAFLNGVVEGLRRFHETELGSSKPLMKAKVLPSAGVIQEARLSVLNFQVARSDVKRHNSMSDMDMHRGAVCMLCGIEEGLKLVCHPLSVRWSLGRGLAAFDELGRRMLWERKAAGAAVFPSQDFPDLAMRMEVWDLGDVSRIPEASSPSLRI